MSLQGEPRILPFLALVFVVSSPGCDRPARVESFDWRQDWAVRDGFSLNVDSQGYDFPSAIAFVPDPGEAPSDPLYFVTELRGKVKVVTNDRSVHTFAEDFADFSPAEELPHGYEGQGGTAGICLDPADGSVFVTSIYRATGQAIRNKIVRFRTTAGTFSLRPKSWEDVAEVFNRDEGGVTHQIGQCHVSEGALYVGVGDGWRPGMSQRLDSTLGKVLRLGLDGGPLPDNPFYRRGDTTASNYVWAFGLRNPFGLEVVDGRVLVADNGIATDRFLEVRSGENYLWDGTDASIPTNSAVVFPKSIAPVQIAYYAGGGQPLPREYDGHVFVAVAGDPKQPGQAPGRAVRGVLAIDYDLEEHRVSSVPSYVAQYRGSGYQSVVGVAIGPDALYFVPLFPDAAGLSAVFKLAFDPEHEHPFLIGRNFNDRDAHASYLIDQKGCLGCHSLNGEGAFVAPALDRAGLTERLESRLGSREYRQSVEAIDQLDREPFTSFASARREVLARSGLERSTTWVKYHLIEPKFDNPASQMPQLGLTEDDADAIASFLLVDHEAGAASAVKRLFFRFFPKQPRYRHVGMAVLLGMACGGAAALLASRVMRHRR